MNGAGAVEVVKSGDVLLDCAKYIYQEGGPHQNLIGMSRRHFLVSSPLSIWEYMDHMPSKQQPYAKRCVWSA